MTKSQQARIKYLLETDSEDLVTKPSDMKLLAIVEERMMSLIAKRMLATPGKMTFQQHKTVQ